MQHWAQLSWVYTYSSIIATDKTLQEQPWQTHVCIMSEQQKYYNFNSLFKTIQIVHLKPTFSLNIHKSVNYCSQVNYISTAIFVESHTKGECYLKVIIVDFLMRTHSKYLRMPNVCTCNSARYWNFTWARTAVCLSLISVYIMSYNSSYIYI